MSPAICVVHLTIPILFWAIPVSLCLLSLGPALYFVLNFSLEWDLTKGWDSILLSGLGVQRWIVFVIGTSDKKFVNGSGGKRRSQFVLLREASTRIRFKGVNVTNIKNVCGVNVNTSITWHSQKAQRELTRFMTFQVNHQKKEVFLDNYIQAG